MTGYLLASVTTGIPPIITAGIQFTTITIHITTIHTTIIHTITTTTTTGRGSYSL
jgi:hypothetical protein